VTQGPRILMTADAVGGVWRYAVDLGRELDTHGVRLTLAVMGPPPAPAQRVEAHEAHIDIVDRPYRLEWMDEPWVDVEQAGSWLLGLERELEPSLVHLNGYAHAARPWRAPVVVVAHSCVASWWRAVREAPPPPSLDRYIDAVKAGLAAAQMVVAPTAAMGAALQAEYGPLLTLRIIPNGIRMEAWLKPGTTDHSPEDVAVEKENLVLAAGRAWDEAKNLAALDAVAAALPWPVYVAGEQSGPDGDVADLRAVHLLGALPRSEMRRWYRRAAIYALPARYEPFGLSVLEAAAAGCALVLGDIASLRENWDGAAVFVPPGDRAGIAGVLRELIERPGWRAELARRARLRASAFSIERTAGQYLQLYQALIA
jgi:glycogen synthase